jgi:hypothetical protein
MVVIVGSSFSLLQRYNFFEHRPSPKNAAIDPDQEIAPRVQGLRGVGIYNHEI